MQEKDGRWTIQGDPTEGALIVAARKADRAGLAGLTAEALEERFPRVGEIPFSSVRKRMSTLHVDTQAPGCLLVFAKGATDILLEKFS